MYVGAILPPLKTTYVCADGPRCIRLLHSELRPSRMMNGRFPRHEFWLTPRIDRAGASHCAHALADCRVSAGSCGALLLQ